LDSLSSTYAVGNPVTNPNVDLRFSRLSYLKGLSLLRMLQSIITDDVFQAGITQFVLDNEYSNAGAAELWAIMDALAEDEGVLADDDPTVAEIMSSYAGSPGYPVIFVEESGDEVVLNQRRFFLDPDQTDDSAKWFIPITLDYADGFFNETQPFLWLKPTDVDTRISLENSDTYVLNVREMGYYRVDYEVSHWVELYLALLNNRESIPSLNRAQLFDDALNLARGGIFLYERALDFMEALKEER